MAIAPIRVAKAQVEIPPGSHHNLAAVRVFFLVEVRAQSVGVHILRDLVREVHVDERLGLNERPVPQLRICEVVPRKRVLKLCEMLLDIIELQGVQVVGLGFVHLDELLISAQTRIRRSPTSFKIALDAVDFHDVPPRHLVPHRVGRQQRGDVHAVDVALDVFHQHVHPAVVSVDVQFAVPATGRVPADDVPHLVNDGVAHQCFVRVRPVQNPVVLRRHAQQRDVVVHPQRVLGLEGV